MVRKKVSLQLIANESNRRATFKKRRKGLMKKASELATLCNVDTFVVVYGAGESQPEVWPETPGEAERVVARFKAVPELDQCKKMVDMEGFLRQSVEKLRVQVDKAQHENRERETALLMHDAIAGRRPGGLFGLSVEDLTSLGCMVESRIRAVMEAIGRLQGEGQNLPAAMAPQPSQPSGLSLSLASYNTGHRDLMQAPHPQGWMMMMMTGGDTGGLAYGGGSGGAGTSAGADMPPQLGGMGFGFACPDAGQSFPSM